MAQAQIPQQLLERMVEVLENPGRRLNEEDARMMRYRDIRKSTASRRNFDVGMDFRDFRTQHENWRTSVGLTDKNNANHNLYDANFQADMLIPCFVGRAASRIKPISKGKPVYQATIGNADEADQNKRFDQYFDRIEALFLPPQESPMTKQQFEDRKQGVDEDISSYVADKIALYKLAYSEAEVGATFDYLKRKVITGVYSQVLRRRMYEGMAAITDEDQLTARALTVLSEEREKYMDGCAESTSLDGLQPVSRTSTRAYTGLGNYNSPYLGASYSGASNQSEPMQIDQLDDDSVNAMRSANKDDTCNRCKKKGHFAKDCRMATEKLPHLTAGLAGRGRGRGGQSSHSGRGQAGRGRSKAPTKDMNKRCGYCNIRGHEEFECRKKKAAQAGGAAGGGAGHGGHSQGPSRGRGGHGRGGGYGVRNIDEGEYDEDYALGETLEQVQPFFDLTG